MYVKTQVHFLLHIFSPVIRRESQKEDVSSKEQKMADQKSCDQCTMRFPMSIDFLEIHRCKNSFLAHFKMKMIHSFCRRCNTAQIFTKEKKYIFFMWFFCGKCWRGGLRRVKFWSNLEKNICKRKVQNSFFLSAALHGEKNFWNNNNIFCCFYKGISRKNSTN